MPAHPFLTTLPEVLLHQKQSVWMRWCDLAETDLELPIPSYGAFVDDRGLILQGSQPVRAWLVQDNPGHLELDPTLLLHLEGCTIVFLDWARQHLSWDEIFELWEAWESQGMIADCGSVAVAWNSSARWSIPGWVAFREGFTGEPLSTVVREAQTVPRQTQASEGRSFMAKALKIRGEDPMPTRVRGERLPMIPFTLKSLRDPSFSWPQGAA